jgi:dTDP-4-amino-4,6-dideoxygalactose transaminase
MSKNEMLFIQEAFDSNWIAPMGSNVDGFESDLREFTKAQYTTALTSATAALHLGLVLFNVEPGDFVICQSFTFAAAANPILYLGGKPIFVDSELDTWNMNPFWLEEAIRGTLATGKKPKAIVFVHAFGMPAKINEIREIATKYDIPLLEDAADALGSLYYGQACGTFGDIGVLSFNGNKIITTSGGGALISDTEAYVTKARFLATQARDDAPHYQHSHIGYNYRMSNV